MTEHVAPDAGVDGDAEVDPADRRALLTKMLVGTAFAVPAVSSFTMGTAGAGAPIPPESPWTLEGNATISGGVASIPTKAAVSQETVRTLAAGARAVFRFQVVGVIAYSPESAKLDWTLSIPSTGGFDIGGTATEVGIYSTEIPAASNPGGNAWVRFVNTSDADATFDLESVSLQEEEEE